MKLLSGAETEKAIKAILQSNEQMQVAVPYWGDGAVERLGLDRLAKPKLRVVCNLSSAACSPDEVRLLRKHLGVKNVLTHRRLHAKVWASPTTVIVGSSNASANGFGLDGIPLAGLVEANVLITEPKLVATVNKWLETVVWANSDNILNDDLLEADDRRMRAMARSIAPDDQTIFAILQNDTSAFKRLNLLVWAYNQDERDDWADESLLTERRLRGDATLDCWQDTRAPAGAHILDFDTSGGTAKFTGMWRILEENHIVREPKGSILLCRKVKKFRHSLPLGGNIKDWEAAAFRASRARSNNYGAEIGAFARDFLFVG